MKDENQPKSLSLGEINIGGVKYLHESDENFDCLTDISNNNVKIHLVFTKAQEKRKQAKNGLKTFFLEIL